MVNLKLQYGKLKKINLNTHEIKLYVLIIEILIFGKYLNAVRIKLNADTIFLRKYLLKVIIK